MTTLFGALSGSTAFPAFFHTREKSQDDIIIPDATGPIAVGVPSGFPITVALFVLELVEY